jgi:hypothetical protein
MKRAISKICVIALMLHVAVGCARTKMVHITSDPNNVSLYINGEQGGQTPFAAKLNFSKKQTYTIMARKKGYKPAVILVQYKLFEQTAYHLVLHPLEKTVTIRSQPSGATVEIMGIECGTTPLKRKLSFVEIDKYEVLVKKFPYRSKTIAISCQPEFQTDYFVFLDAPDSDKL